MNQSRRGECENVVELLVKEYFAKYRSDLNRKIGSITAEFIRRGLSNSSGMVTEQMGAEFWYLDGLVNYVIGSLKEKFHHISLFDCKDKLVAILDTEYKRLIPKANSLLVKAGLANQANLDRLQKRILGELERAKEKIEIQCAILEKERAASIERGNGEKPSQNLALKAATITLIVAVITFVSAIFTSPLWIPFISKMFGNSHENAKTITSPKTSDDYSPPTMPSRPNSDNYESLRPEKLDTKPAPLVKKDETSIEPEETEADVNEAKEKRLRNEEADFDKANRTGDPGGTM
jgi:ElaB/YqjD/DUF883 family membrane-anchored ribosome-binding protein